MPRWGPLGADTWGPCEGLGGCRSGLLGRAGVGVWMQSVRPVRARWEWEFEVEKGRRVQSLGHCLRAGDRRSSQEPGVRQASVGCCWTRLSCTSGWPTAPRQPCPVLRRVCGRGGNPAVRVSVRVQTLHTRQAAPSTHQSLPGGPELWLGVPWWTAHRPTGLLGCSKAPLGQGLWLDGPRSLPCG